jgi:hypothetical protein
MRFLFHLKGLAGNQQQSHDGRNVDQEGDRTGTAGAPAVSVRVPVEKKAQILCSLRLFYGFHPDTRD